MIAWSRIRRATFNAPIDVVRVREALGVIHEMDDARIMQAIDAGTAYIEGPDGAGVAIADSQWIADLPSFADMQIPLGPIKQIDSINYYDEDDAAQTVASFQLDTTCGAVLPAVGESWPSVSARVNPVSITFTTGHDVVPPDLLRAVEALAVYIYEHPEAVIAGTIATEMPLGVMSIVERYRRGRF